MGRHRRPVLERLMQYYRLLSDRIAKETTPIVTSAWIAEALEIDPTQVRKDFAAIGIQGMNRLGYDMHDICGAIRSDLGFDQRYEAILLGSGHLGRALLTYSGFSRYGLHILRAFSSDSDHVGHRLGSCTIKPMRELEPFLRNRLIPLVILVPPTEASEELAHRLVAAGVKAIWNFTPTHLLTPRLGVLVRNEKHFSLGLSEISYHLKE